MSKALSPHGNPTKEHPVTRPLRRWAGAIAATLAVTLSAACGSLTTNGATNNAPAPSGDAAGSGMVAMLLPENQTARWEEQDAPAFKDSMARLAPGVDVQTFNAQGDPGTQLKQAETALTNGAKALVVVSVDQYQAAQIVTLAKRQNVPVISYDHFIRKADLDYYVAVDGERVGQLQGQWLAENTEQGDAIAVVNGSTDDENARLFNTGYMSVLQPLFDSGARTKAGETWVQGWVPSTAQQGMEQILTATNDKVDAVMVANDGMAVAVVQALNARGLAGQVPVTGLDGTLASDQLILRGQQSMSVWRSLKKQADIAAQITTAAIKGEQPDAALFTGTKNNEQRDVPWAQVDAQVITKDNMNLIVEDGSVDKTELCKGIPAGTGPC